MFDNMITVSLLFFKHIVDHLGDGCSSPMQVILPLTHLRPGGMSGSTIVSQSVLSSNFVEMAWGRVASN